MSVSPTIAQENLILLQSHRSSVAKGLLAFLQSQRESGESPLFQTAATLSGFPTLVKREGGRMLSLHDPVQPTRESSEQARELLSTHPGLTVVYSSGLGYLPCALVPLLETNLLETNRILIAEPDYELLFLAMQVSDWRALLPSPNLLLLAGPDAVAETGSILERYGSLQNRGIRIVAGRGLLPGEDSILETWRENAQSGQNRHATCQAGTKTTDSSRLGVAVSEVHRDLLDTLCRETRATGREAVPIFYSQALRPFSGGGLPVWETAGHPLPGTVLAFSPGVFSTAEWEEMGTLGVRRLLWFFDDPFRFELNEPSLAPIDRLFCFDPILTRKLQERFSRSVTYMPAATSFPDGISGAPPRNLPAPKDIVFVGSTGLQRFEERFVRWFAQNPPAMRPIRDLVAQRLREGRPLSYDEILALDLPVSGLSPLARIHLVEDIVTFWIRCEFLSVLPEERSAIYGDPGWSIGELTGNLKRLFTGRSLDFTREAPWIYRDAAININIFNVQCVDSPILRLFDILACGGFLLTEYRPFLESLFCIGEELDVFRTPAELRDKIGFYLARPECRHKIAHAGQERIMREHRYRNRFPLIWR